MIPIYFNGRLFTFLFIGFIIATVAGTLSHECGHWLMSRYYGFKKSRITYANTSYCGFNEKFLREVSIYKQYPNEIHQHLNFPLKDEYDTLRKETSKEWMIIQVAGPLQTMFTGTIGLLLLFLYRKKIVGAERLFFSQWLLVFLSLFWLREIFNLVTAVVLLLTGRIRMHGDEFVLAKHLDWNPWSISVVAGIASLCVLWLVIFKVIPAKQRFTFIIAGLTGGLSGAYLWLILLGPRLMP